MHDYKELVRSHCLKDVRRRIAAFKEPMISRILTEY